MNDHKRFLLVRASIYLTGLAIVLWVIGSNIWEIKEKTVAPVQAENGDFVVYTDKNYQTAQLTIEFENQIPENFTAQIQKDFSIFLKSRKRGVYSEKDLEEKLLKNNTSLHLNGSFLKRNNKIYFLDEGELRKLDTTETLDFFNLNKQHLPEITPEEFDKFSQEKILKYRSIQKDFPKNILIKKGDFFYITGDDGYHPIHIPNLEEFQKKLNFQSSTISGKLEIGKCFKVNNKTANCLFDLGKKVSNSGNIYRIQIDNKAQKINNLKAKFKKKLNFDEVKRLFLK